MRSIKILMLYLFLQLCFVGNMAFALEAAGAAPPPATALFLVNNAGKEYEEFIPALKDNLTSLLTQKGFSVVRSENAMPPSGLTDSNENKISDPQAEASLNRLAESLKAGLLIVSTINAVTHDENEFDGSGTIYKSNNKTAVDTVRINLQVYDVGSTKSVYGDSVNTSLRTPVYGQSQTRTILINLFHDAAVRIADNITNKVSTINSSASAPAKKASFSISTNVASVDVFIDGMVVGSVGNKTTFEATSGIHQLKLGKEMLKSWEKTVNIVDGAKYSAQLELSAEGLSRYKNIEAFNIAMKAANVSIDVAKKQAEADIEMQKKQADADAKATVEVAKGERVKREHSYIRDDGFVENLKKLQ